MSWLRPIDIWFGERVFPFQTIHRRYAHKLTRDEHEAEDLVQEAYARLFQLSTWAQINNPHAFTMRILHNLAVEKFRRADVLRIDQAAAMQAFDPIDEAPGPDVAVMARSQLALVASALEVLPDRCREAVHLRRVEGFTPSEVAEKMQISVSTVEKHLTKGLRLLFSVLSKLENTGQTGSGSAGFVSEWDRRTIRERQ